MTSFKDMRELLFLSHGLNFIDNEDFLVLTCSSQKILIFPMENIESSRWMKWPSPSVWPSSDSRREMLRDLRMFSTSHRHFAASKDRRVMGSRVSVCF